MFSARKNEPRAAQRFRQEAGRCPGGWNSRRARLKPEFHSLECGCESHPGHCLPQVPAALDGMAGLAQSGVPPRTTVWTKPVSEACSPSTIETVTRGLSAPGDYELGKRDLRSKPAIDHGRVA